MMHSGGDCENRTFRPNHTGVVMISYWNHFVNNMTWKKAPTYFQTYSQIHPAKIYF